MGRGHFIGVLDVKKIGGGHLRGGLGQKFKNIWEIHRCTKKILMFDAGRGNIRGGLGDKHF